MTADFSELGEEDVTQQGTYVGRRYVDAFEMTWRRSGPPNRKPRRYSAGETNAERSLRRAVTDVRRYVVANRLSRLYVLTLAPPRTPGLEGLRSLKQDLRRLLRRLQRHLPIRQPYLCAFETHESGCWHANFLTTSLVERQWVKEAWDRGHVGRRTFYGGHLVDPLRALAWYVTKQFEVDFADMPKHRRFSTSLGFTPRCEDVQFDDVDALPIGSHGEIVAARRNERLGTGLVMWTPEDERRKPPTSGRPIRESNESRAPYAHAREATSPPAVA